VVSKWFPNLFELLTKSR